MLSWVANPQFVTTAVPVASGVHSNQTSLSTADVPKFTQAYSVWPAVPVVALKRLYGN